MHATYPISATYFGYQANLQILFLSFLKDAVCDLYVEMQIQTFQLCTFTA